MMHKKKLTTFTIQSIWSCPDVQEREPITSGQGTVSTRCWERAGTAQCAHCTPAEKGYNSNLEKRKAKRDWESKSSPSSLFRRQL